MTQQTVTSQQASFNPREWLTLQFAPLWVFLAVAGADGKIDKKELNALLLELGESRLYRDPLTREILASLHADFENLLLRFEEDRRDVTSSLSLVAEILDEKAAITEDFKKALLLIGHKVADASGTGSWGTHQKISNEEKDTLDQIAAVMNQPVMIDTSGDIKQQITIFRKIYKFVTSPLFLSMVGIIFVIVGSVFVFVFFANIDSGSSAETTSGYVSMSTLGLGCFTLLGALMLPSLSAGMKMLPRGVKISGAVISTFLLLASCFFIWFFTSGQAETVQEITAERIEEISEESCQDSIEEIEMGNLVITDTPTIVANTLAFCKQDAWTFEGISNQVVTIEMAAQDRTLDPKLTLIGPLGEMLVTTNYTYNPDALARVNMYLVEDGTYKILAQSVLRTKGSYRLTVKPGQAQQIKIGQPKQIYPAENYVWQFTGKLGQIVSLKASLTGASDVDPYGLTIIGPKNNGVNERAEGPSTTELNNVILTQDGTYTVTLLSPGEAESYSLALTEVTSIDPNYPEAAALFVKRGKAYAKQIDYDQAIADYKKAAADFQQAIALEDDNPGYYNTSCWFGSLLGDAEKVLTDCEKAVELATELNSESLGGYRDSRGLARALTGDGDGAIADFQVYVERSKQNGDYEQYGKKREFWIEVLEKGDNPFDEATLDSLRNE